MKYWLGQAGTMVGVVNWRCNTILTLISFKVLDGT
jgi:hypothetical protein